MTEQIDRARKDYYRARVENLREQVPMVKVLEHLNVRVHVNENVEIQYPCPLHGDGKDNGYSARVYPETDGDPGGHTYCWGCSKHRDQIGWVMEYEGTSFMGAVKLLESAFAVVDIPNVYDFFDPSASVEGDEGKTKLSQEIETILEGDPVVRGFDYLERKIDRLVQDYKSKLNMGAITRLYFVYDKMRYDLDTEALSMEKASNMAERLEAKINTLARG